VDARSLEDIKWVEGLFSGMKLPRDSRFVNLRTYSNAVLSFSDTTVGGNIAINAPPQFTFFADPPITGALAAPQGGQASEENTAWFQSFSDKGSYRQGAYYWESIEQNAFYLHCRFGKPKYLGMAAFFANMYDSKLAYLARTGDYPSIIRTLATYTAAAAIFATVGVGAFALIMVVPRIISLVLDKEASKYYYVKPTMHLYLRAVQNIINTQLMYRRLVPTGVLNTFALDRDVTDQDNKYHSEMRDAHSGLPTIWKANGEFDIYRMINRYQVLANYQAERMKEIRDSTATEAEMNQRIQEYYKEMLYSNTHINRATQMEVSLADLESIIRKSKGYEAKIDPDTMEAAAVDQMTGALVKADKDGGTEKNYTSEAELQERQLKAQQAQQAGNSDEEATARDIGKIQNWMNEGQKSTWGTLFDGIAKLSEGLKEQFKSEVSNGSQWVTWKINGRDSTNRSFSNNTKEPEISGAVNSVTGKARSLEVNLSAGQTGIDAVDGLVTGLKSAFTGALDFLHLSGIVSLYNSSVIDFPEVWDSSDSSGDDINLTIPLRCWSGSDLDVFQDLILPLSFWLAAVCPLATGKQSFTHPFYLEAYARGRFSMRNAMVTNVSFNFGVGGMGWRVDGVPLSCDISVTIRDLSRVMYMPIVTDTSAWDDSNKFSEFMAVLGAATLHERTSGYAKGIMNANIQFQSWRSAFSQGALVNKFFDLPPARVAANIFSAFGSSAR